MRSAAELSHTIPIVLELAPELEHCLDPARAAAAELEPALSGDIQSLGLEGTPIIEPRLGGGERAVRVRVHNELLPCSATEMAAAWAAAAPPELSGLAATTAGPGSGPPGEWFRAWAGDGGDGAAFDPDLVTGFIRELVRSVLLRRADCLVGQGQVAAFLSTWRGRERVAQDVAERDTRDVLRSLLALELSVAAGAVVWEALVAGWHRRQPAEDTVEAAAAALRPNRIEVHAHPALVQDLGGQEGDQRLVSVQSEAAGPTIREAFERMELGLYGELGVRLPELFLRREPELPENSVRVRINHRLGTARVAHGPTTDALVRAVGAEIGVRGSALVGIEDVEYQLTRLDELFQELVSASLEALAMGDLTRVLRALVAEQVPVRDVRAIIERLLQFGTVEVDPLERLVIDERLPVAPGTPPLLAARWQQHLAFVRSGSGLRNQLTQLYGESRGVTTSVAVIRLDRELERRVRTAAAATSSAGGGDPTLERVRDKLLADVHARLARGMPALLVRDPLLRPLIRAMVADELPHLPVVVRRELRPDVAVVEAGADGDQTGPPELTPTVETPPTRPPPWRAIPHPRLPRRDRREQAH